MIPPLLNDFIGLQKDSALVALLGVTEAFQSRRSSGERLNFTPYVALALVSSCLRSHRRGSSIG